MKASAYRELEKILERSLKAFAHTKQKLNRFERGRRDQVAAILGDVMTKRKQQERARSAPVSNSLR